MSRSCATHVQGAERIESLKAAALAAVGGAAGALPFVFSSSQPGQSALLAFAASVAACFLFGVTYRYAVRQDVSNAHLKGGVVAAFGLVKAIGAADMLQSMSPDAFSIGVLGNAALYAGQSMLTVAFAATALEAGFNNGFVKRFDSRPHTGASQN